MPGLDLISAVVSHGFQRALLLSGLALPVAAAAGDPCIDGEALWKAGRRVEALEQLQLCLTENAADEERRQRLGEQLMEVHRVEAALDILEPLDASADALRGRALYLLGRYDEAIALLDEDDLLSAIMLIDALEAGGKLEAAGAAADRAAVRFGDGHVRLVAWRGRRAARAGRHLDAEPLFRKALELEPADLESLYGLGQALVRSGRRDAGLAVLEQHRRLVPLMDRHDYALRAVDLNPIHAANLAQLADIERLLGRTDDAERHYRLAFGHAKPDGLPPVALRLARFLVDARGDVDGAVAILDEAAMVSSDARLPVRAGDILMAADQPGAAARRYGRAQKLRPDDGEILERLRRAENAQLLRPDGG